MTEEKSHCVFLYVTAPNAEIAARIARALVEEKLAACVNIHGEMRSLYEWNGNVELKQETPLFVKTTTIMAEKARDRIMVLHPHETPCIAALPIQQEGSSQAFLNWVASTTNS